MKNKKLFIIWISLLIIIILALIIINLPKEEVYSDDPKTWIITEGVEKEIDVEKITEGAGFIDDLGQQLRTDTIETVFDYEGFYKGNHFKREYIDENQKVRMRINPNINPNDGVIEGFIIEKVENNKPMVYIFVDEDWKQSLEFTNILWGRTFQNTRAFNFNQLSKGIYMDEIEDDSTRIEENYNLRFGGIIVGDLNQEKIDKEDPDVTYIYFS